MNDQSPMTKARAGTSRQKHHGRITTCSDLGSPARTRMGHWSLGILWSLRHWLIGHSPLQMPWNLRSTTRSFSALLLALLPLSASAQTNLGATMTTSLLATQGQTITYTVTITNL